MFYQHTHPLSSMEFKMADVKNSGFFDDYVTSNDLQRLKKTAYQDVMLKEGADFVERLETLTQEEKDGDGETHES